MGGACTGPHCLQALFRNYRDLVLLIETAGTATLAELSARRPLRARGLEIVASSGRDLASFRSQVSKELEAGLEQMVQSSEFADESPLGCTSQGQLRLVLCATSTA